MTQDTRKDRRVKIVSLNVRYKSATVDEFIENHAHDVSRGGIYIKTSNPFPQGTLLKFEIRLSSDQTVITGVGRVVWKREAAQGEQPAGMGVKFIKVDDSSKVVIDRLVTTKADAGKAFESEPDTTALPRSPSLSEPAGSPSSPPGSKRAPVPYKAGSGSASSAPPSLRASVMPVTPSSPSAPSRPATPPPLFPKASSHPEAPKGEQTVMKQAAELLEEALREAGGSMEEVGTNPLFTGSAEASAPPVLKEAGVSKAPPLAAGGPRDSKGPAKATEPGVAARGMVAAMSPGRPARSGSESDAGESKGQKAAAASSTRPPRKGGSSMGIILGIVAVVGISGVALNREKLFGAPPEPAPPPTAAPPPVPSAPPSAAPSASEAPSAGASADNAPGAAPSGSAAPSASAAPDAAPAASASAAPGAKPVVPGAAAAGSSSPASATPDAAPAASASPRPPKPSPPAVVVKPAPKPAKPPSDNDNPY